MLLITFSLLLITSQVSLGGVEVGYTNVFQDTIAGETRVEYGQVPDWIEGSYIRTSCGAFGETGSNLEIVNKVEHLFDCIEMGQSYKFENGKVTFYNRYYDSAKTDIWRSYNMNMNESRVFWDTTYSRRDREQELALADTIANSGKIATMPHVTFWQMGNEVFAHSEYPGLVQLDPHDLSNAISFHEFDDNNFGFGPEIILDEMAHEVQDPDGTLYCAHMVFSFNPLQYRVHQWKNVFTIKDNVRRTLTRIPYPDLDLSLCDNGTAYPIHVHRQGYLHSMAATENYLILPESSYLVDICSVIVRGRTDEPVFSHYFDWEADFPTRFQVIRKSDGALLATINTTAVFVTHQLNAYEEGNFIHADMIAFHDSSPYTHYTYVQRLISAEEQENDIERFTINMADWSLTRRPLVAGPVSTDFPNINPNYLMRRYTYAYTIFGIYTGAAQIIGKVNVDTGHILEYELPDGLFGFEPLFLPTENSIAEDDGVIILQGLDANQEKGFLMIFDARDMSLISHVTAPDLVLFGIHAKFYPSHVGSMQDVELPIGGATSFTISALILAAFNILMFAVMYV